MNRKLLAVVAVLALVTSVGVAYVVGIGPAPGGDSGTDIESFPTETSGSSTGGDGGGDGDGTAATATGPPFTFVINRIETCGNTCRNVTTTLTNEQSTTATSVTVYTRIYAGNGTDGDVVWEGTEPVGTLAAGESVTATKRVRLSYREGYAVRRNGGWITVRTSVAADSETMTFTQRRDVI